MLASVSSLRHDEHALGLILIMSDGLCICIMHLEEAFLFYYLASFAMSRAFATLV